MIVKKNWLESPDLIEISAMLKSLSHPSRMAIMYLISQHPEKRMTVKSIYDKLKMSQPVISRHLGILKQSGLLTRFNEGIKTYYEIKLSNRNTKKITECFSSIK